MVVKFLHYAGTMQETCLRLMGKKLLVSLAMEGKFAAEGLQAMEEGDDLLMAMARELVTEQHIGETADQVWAALQKQQSEAFGIRAEVSSGSDTEAANATESVAEPLVPIAPAPAPGLATQLLMFGASLESGQRRKASRRPAVTVIKAPNQMTLF